MGSANAQLIPDASLGSEGSVITPHILINGSGATRIDGGAQRGANLFHSFQEFNVNTGQRVYFANPSGIDTILSRVTGNTLSSIDGLLGVDGAADLVLLNPHGIWFGPNAQLDISGSFLATTTDGIDFADGREFSATPTTGELLSLSVPLGVQANRLPVADVTTAGRLETGQDLTLWGQNLWLSGQLLAGQDLSLYAADTVTIRDTPVEVFSAHAAGDLTIQGTGAIDILALNHPDHTPFVSGGTLRLISDGVISGDARFASGGGWYVLTLAGAPGDLVSFYDPIIQADGDVVFGNYTGAALKVEATGSIAAGEITITGPDLGIPASDPDAAVLTTLPALILRAGVSSVANPNIPITTGGTPFTGGAVTGFPPGSISIGDVNTDTAGSDDAGPILLSALGNITTGELSAFSQGIGGNAGNGGAITLKTETGDITVNGRIFADSSVASGGDAGDGGVITLIANNGNITLADVIATQSRSNDGNAGNGGAVRLSARGDITTRGMGTFAEATGGNAGNGGAITLRTETGDITVSGRSFADSFVASGGDAGDGGVVTLIASNGNITLTDVIATQSRSDDGNAGDGGAVRLSARGDITTGGVGAFAQATGGNAGNGGAITLRAETGNITVNGQIFADSFAESGGNAGDGGAVTLLTDNGNIILADVIAASSFSGDGSADNGGDVRLSATRGRITGPQGGSQIVTFAVADTVGQDAGSGGNVLLEAATAISNLEIFTLSSDFLSDAGDVRLSGFGDLTINDLEIRTSQATLPSPTGGTIDVTGVGLSGDITVESTGGLSLDQVILESNTQSTLPAGLINVSSSGRLTVNNSAFTSSTEAAGDGGGIRLSGIDGITLNGTDLRADSDGAGNAGGIDIVSSASGDIVLNRSGITTTTLGSGTGGRITLALARAAIIDATELKADTGGAGEAGDIAVRDVEVLVLRRGSLLLANAFGQSFSNGGDIDIVADFVVAVPSENNDIIANSIVGDGGNITIFANNILGFTQPSGLTFDQLRSNTSNDISASSEFGLQGTIDIDTLDLDPSRGLATLPVSLDDPANQIAAGCGPDATVAARQSEFIVSGRGGLPASPNDLDAIAPSATSVPWVTDEDGAAARVPATPAAAADSLLEADGWITRADGQVYFIAADSAAAPAPASTVTSQACALASEVEP